MFVRPLARRRAALAGASLVALAAAAVAPTLALAQVAPLPIASPTAGAAEVEALVVTGSRLVRSEYDSASPIQVITGEQSTLEGLADTAEMLQHSALASGSLQVNNQFTNGIGTDAVAPGSNYIALRGLGPQRTLVLLNGRRLGPAGVSGVVGAFDLNVLPISLINRVEILKDGASSIYGSDAVAGVVNVITKTDFDGLQFNALGSLSQDGGGNQFQTSLTWGKTFDRGYLTLAADYTEQQALRTRQRKDTACSADYLFSPDGSRRLDYMSALTPGTYKCYNIQSAYVSTTTWGTITPTIAGLTYPTIAQGNAGTGNVPVPAGFARFSRAGYPLTYPYAPTENPLYDNATVISPSERSTLYAAGGFDLTPKVELFGEALFNRRESEQISVGAIFPSFAQRNIVNGALNALPANNPNNPFGQPVVPVTAYESPSYQTVDYMRLLGGLRGDASLFGVDWRWEAYGQWSKSDASYNLGQRVYLDRLLALYSPGAACTNTPAGGNVSNFNCAALPNGIPWTSARVLNGQFTDAERAFLFFTEDGKTTYEHKYVEATASGDIFTLPAGPVGAALGVHFREESINDTPGLNSRTRNIAFYSSSDITKGSDRVSEAFGEFNIPLLKDAAFVEALDLNLSGRYSDYKSYGDSKTYKVGVNWQIAPALRLRLTQGDSFRAPALYEQFLGAQTSYLGQSAVDPCYNYGSTNVSGVVAANCAKAGIPPDYLAIGSASATILNNGGAGVLTAETALSRTAGLVWTPGFAKFSAAVDYWTFDIDDEVRQYGAANILSQCYGRADFPNNAFCGLFTREAGTNKILRINNSYVNVAEQRSRGIDLNTRWVQDEVFGGRVVSEGEFTWTLQDTTLLLAATNEIDENGSPLQPDFSGKVHTRYERGDWTFNWTAEMIGKSSYSEIAGGDVFPNTRYNCIALTAGCSPVASPALAYAKQHAEFTAYHDLSFRYRRDDWTLQAGVRNVFDERPPALSNAQGLYRGGVAAAGLYDPIGRRGWVNVGKRF